MFCDQPADSFGPKKLAKLRDELIKEGNSRKYINERIRYTIKIFKIAQIGLKLTSGIRGKRSNSRG